MGAALGIAALAVSAAAVIFAGLTWWDARRSAAAAGRSAAAAESADRHERVPQLAIVLEYRTPAPGDQVFYRVRNDGPQDLDSVVIHRPQPPDRVIYKLAVPGAGGWSDDEIDLGTIAVPEDRRFTLFCGTNVELPEFRVRIDCKAGADKWVLSHLLPPPRGEPLTEDERRRREEIPSAAVAEIERNIGKVGGESWQVIPLPDESLMEAHRLLRENARGWAQPTREALDSLDDFKAWRELVGSPTEDQLRSRREPLLQRLSEASTRIEEMSAALNKAKRQVESGAARRSDRGRAGSRSSNSRDIGRRAADLEPMATHLTFCGIPKGIRPRAAALKGRGSDGADLRVLRKVPAQGRCEPPAATLLDRCRPSVMAR